MRFCGCSNRNGTSTGCAPSTWTDRCPADSFTRTSSDWRGSAIGKVMGLAEVLSRTALDCGNCKTGASNPRRIASRMSSFPRRGVPDCGTGDGRLADVHEPAARGIIRCVPSRRRSRRCRRHRSAGSRARRPRAARRGSATRMPPRADQRLEDAAVVRLEADAAERPGQPQLRQIARLPWSGSSSGPRASTAPTEARSICSPLAAERFFNQARPLRASLSRES